jgi:hypothetical protein
LSLARTIVSAAQNQYGRRFAAAGDGGAQRPNVYYDALRRFFDEQVSAYPGLRRLEQSSVDTAQRS